MFKRFIAMLAVCALLLGATALYYGQTGMRTDGIFYQASGIRPDAAVIRVDGQPIPAEEFLYWLDSVCGYLTSYAGSTPDFSTPVTDEMTLGQFAKEDAANTSILYAVVRKAAVENGISLTEEDFASLDAQRQEYVNYYGSEEIYLQQLQVLGLPEDTLHAIEEVPYLYNRLLMAFSDPDSELYPGEEALRKYGEEGGFVTAQLLYFPFADLTDAECEALKNIAAEYAQTLSSAADKAATYELLAAQLGLTTMQDGLTFSAAEADAMVHAAVSALDVGEVSSVIPGTNGYYVALRLETNYAFLLEDLFNIYLQDRQDSATIEYTDRYYERLDTGSFYSALLRARADLLTTFSGS